MIAFVLSGDYSVECLLYKNISKFHSVVNQDMHVIKFI